MWVSIRSGQTIISLIAELKDGAQGLKRNSCSMGPVMQKINPLDVVQEQYQHLKYKLRPTPDVRGKNILFRRLINLAGVMQFLISVNKKS